MGWSQKGSVAPRNPRCTLNKEKLSREECVSSCSPRAAVTRALTGSVSEALYLPLLVRADCLLPKEGSALSGQEVQPFSAQLPGWQEQLSPGAQAVRQSCNHTYLAQGQGMSKLPLHSGQAKSRKQSKKKDTFQITTTATAIRACYNVLAS